MNLNHWKFQNSHKKWEIETVTTDFKRELYQFEMSSLKTQTKIIKFQKEQINKSIERLKRVRRDLYGFNLWAAFAGTALFHMTTISYTKKLLYEMERGAPTHIALCVAFGVASGYLVGYTIASDINLYRIYSKTLKQFDSINNDFERYYIQNKEQEFDE